MKALRFSCVDDRLLSLSPSMRLYPILGSFRRMTWLVIVRWRLS